MRALFWTAALFALVMAVLPHPPRLPGDPSDKVQHVIAFATLGVLASFAYPSSSVLRLAALLSVFGAGIELIQAIAFLHRDSSALDWLADTLASGLALIAMRRAWRLD